jgi:hypothetical protein
MLYIIAFKLNLSVVRCRSEKERQAFALDQDLMFKDLSR